MSGGRAYKVDCPVHSVSSAQFYTFPSARLTEHCFQPVPYPGGWPAEVGSPPYALPYPRRQRMRPFERTRRIGELEAIEQPQILRAAIRVIAGIPRDCVRDSVPQGEMELTINRDPNPAADVRVTAIASVPKDGTGLRGRSSPGCPRR